MQRAAGAELNRREHGGKRQAHASRPFGSASTEDVRDFAHKPEGGYEHEDGLRRMHPHSRHRL
jgi:hypothetical protein